MVAASMKLGSRPAANLSGGARVFRARRCALRPDRPGFRSIARGQMFQAYDGLIFLIDVGMSRAVGYSAGAVLHVHTGKHPRATAIYPTAGPKQLWP